MEPETKLNIGLIGYGGTALALIIVLEALTLNAIRFFDMIMRIPAEQFGSKALFYCSAYYAITAILFWILLKIAAHRVDRFFQYLKVRKKINEIHRAMKGVDEILTRLREAGSGIASRTLNNQEINKLIGGGKNEDKNDGIDTKKSGKQKHRKPKKDSYRPGKK